MTDATYGAPPPQARPHGSGLAIGALVLGILALLFCWTVVGGILFGIIAIILGVIASGRAKRNLATGRGMAITGVVLGVLGLLLSVVLVVFVGTVFSKSGAKTYVSCVKDAGNDQAKLDKCETKFRNKLEN